MKCVIIVLAALCLGLVAGAAVVPAATGEKDLETSEFFWGGPFGFWRPWRPWGYGYGGFGPFGFGGGFSRFGGWYF